MKTILKTFKSFLFIKNIVFVQKSVQKSKTKENHIHIHSVILLIPKSEMF